MKKIVYGFFILLLLVLAATVIMARHQARNLTHNPVSERFPLEVTPADVHLEYKDVTVLNEKKMLLHGWYVPPKNGAVIMLIHGYKFNRGSLIEEAEIFVRHGYGVLFCTIRAQDINEGELLTFGLREMPDFDAWYRFLEEKEGIRNVAMFGESLGGFIALHYASINKDIKAVATHSAFSSMEDTIDTSIKFFTGLPPFPFSPMIQFWAEREIDGHIEELDAKKWISQISPRAVFIMHGGSDKIVSPESGELLYEAAKEPKELWFEPELGHGGFEHRFPQEFEKRLTGFYDRYLLLEK